MRAFEPESSCPLAGAVFVVSEWWAYEGEDLIAVRRSWAEVEALYPNRGLQPWEDRRSFLAGEAFRSFGLGEDHEVRVRVMPLR